MKTFNPIFTKFMMCLALAGFSASADLAFSLSASARTEGGNEGGHAGDVYSLEFKTIADSLGQKLAAEETRSSQAFVKWNFRAVDFRKTAAKVTVASADPDEMVLRGQEVDGINFPKDNLIKINRNRWREGNLRTRTALVLHEVFGIMGVERDSFEASLDFKTFLTNASKEMETELADSLQANLFYGQCQSFPNLSDPSTCDSSSDKVEKARICSVNQAESKCRLSGKGKCELVNTSYSARMSKEQFGLRYCEVLVIMK